MSDNLDENGIRVRIELTPTQHPEELAVWSFYTGRRDRSDYDDLGSEIDGWLEASYQGDMGGGMAEVSTVRYFIDEWQTPILSADSWGTAWSAERAGFGAAGSNALPPQIALAVSRRTFDEDLSQRRSYNRAYVGPMGVNSLASDGRVIETYCNTVITAWKSLDVILQSVPQAGGVDSAYRGLCNVSYKGKPGIVGSPAQIAATNRLFVGTLFDTQRTRRNALDELWVVDDFNPVATVTGLKAGLS